MTRIKLQMQLFMTSGEVNILAPYYGTREEAAGITKEEFYGKKFKCIWLLHGLGGTADDWERFTQIETFAEEKGIFVISPSAGAGFYVDGPKGQGEMWETRIMSEIWDYLHVLFPLMSDKPEDNFVAGLSMGGHGAMRYALAYPDKFSFGASLSGGLNVPQRYAEGESINGRLHLAFGPREEVVGSKYDLYKLAKDVKERGGRLPKLYVSVGTLDWEHEPNKAYCEHLKGLGYDVEWEAIEGHGHEWRLWNQQIEKVLNKVIPENAVSARFTRGQAKD